MRPAPAKGASGATALPALNFVFEGDSLTGANAWAATFAGLVTADGYPVTSNNLAQSGSTMASHAAWPYLNSRTATVDALKSATKQNFLFVLEGVNDIINSYETIASLEALQTTYINARVAAGWTVVLCTQLANWDNVIVSIPTINTMRLAYNTWVLTPQTAKYIDFAANPILGTDPMSGTWTSDGLHPNTDGARVMAKQAYIEWRRFQLLSVRTVLASFSVLTGTVGTSVTLHGVGFTGATSVRFNGTAASFSVVSDTAITTTVPSGATTGTVAVTSPSGSDTSLLTFTVT